MKTRRIVLLGLTVGLLFAGALTLLSYMSALAKPKQRASATGMSGILLPSADGAYSQWIPKNGTSTPHYTMVNDMVCNGTSTYNFARTAGNRDSYKVSIASIPDKAAITQISITPCASNDLVSSQSSTAAVMRVFYRFNGVSGPDRGNYKLAGIVPYNLATTTFSGLSLVKSSSSILEIGAVISSSTSNTRGARLSRIAATITYANAVSSTIPAAPSNLSAAASSSSFNVFLRWRDNSNNENGFGIERGTSSIRFIQIATSGVNISTYTDFAVATGTYYYRVRAFNNAGNSGYSNVASTTVRVR